MTTALQGHLKGKTALITGSTSGIGKGIAQRLAEAGANIILNGIEPEDQIAPIVEEMADSFGVKVVYSPANMMKPEEIQAMFDMVGETFGGVDVLVNNAGIQHVEAIETFPEGKWDAIIAINMSSNFHTIKGALPYMKAQAWGRIVNIASAHGLVASPYKSAYVTAKHGVVGMTKTVALEVAEHGITCNAICPGYVWTPLVEAQIPDQAKTRGISEEDVINKVLLKNQPTKQFAQVNELAELTYFLSTDAARSITGTSLPVDGGWTAQ